MTGAAFGGHVRTHDDEGPRTAPLSTSPEHVRGPTTSRRAGSARPAIDRCRHDERDRPSCTGPFVDHRPISGSAADTHCHPFVSIHARIQRAIHLTVYRHIVPSPLTRGNPPGRLQRRSNHPRVCGDIHLNVSSVVLRSIPAFAGGILPDVSGRACVGLSVPQTAGDNPIIVAPAWRCQGLPHVRGPHLRSTSIHCAPLVRVSPPPTLTCDVPPEN